MTAALRIAAAGIALAALIDPHVTVPATRPLPVDIRAVPSPADPDGTAARRVRSALTMRLGETAIVTRNSPRAVVLIGGAGEHDDIPDGVPVSTISLEPRGRNVRVLDARATDVVVAGQRAIVSVDLEASGARGETSVVVLERDGLELARASYAWRADAEHASVALTCAAADRGLVPLRVRVLPLSGEAAGQDNVADVSVRTVNRPLRILAWEPRPSWSTAFVRRALEADPAFDVSSVVRSSRGLDTRAGTPPAALTAVSLTPFDLVIVGAPEDLRRGDVEALEVFVRKRGGAVLLLPDRAPAGEYLRLLPAGRFDEVLLDRPATLRGAAAAGFQASEFALPPAAAGQGAAIASLAHSGGERPAVVSWPLGAGTVVFSGAMDAWRYRGNGNDPFARFWTGLVASLAAQSPPALSVLVEPSMAAPGDRVTIRARYRPTELASDAAATRVPAVNAAIVTGDGETSGVRLWPSAAPGEYEGTLDAPPAGRYDVRVSGGDGAAADAVLSVGTQVRTRRLTQAPTWLAGATGGVAAHAADTQAVEAFLRGTERHPEPIDVHPMRSGWWIVPFAAALCAEWALRRRKGLR